VGATERRVLGVLIEKAKTTPESYPLSLNALRVGCNQKNNRAPQTQLEEPQVEEALDGLRQAGAVMVVQGDSRVDRFRHLAYEWLGVDKVELAVMAELLLRGSQTVGELRGRAARMEPIKDLHELQPVLASLEAKRLIVYLTPPGRGCMLTHNLYLDREWDKVKRDVGGAGQQEAAPPAERTVPVERQSTRPASPQAGRTTFNAHSPPDAVEFTETLGGLREEIESLKRELASVRAEMDSSTQSLREELAELNRQLGN
jgi:uncharacterized protein YceH (UPF0502 family)